jgi:hypothetical protein
LVLLFEDKYTEQHSTFIPRNHVLTVSYRDMI